MGALKMSLKVYRRGFVCLPGADQGRIPAEYSSWRRLSFGDWLLAVHPELTTQVAEVDREGTIVALGEVFVAHGGESLEESLARVLWGERRTLDALSGRFALLLFRAGELSVLHDPLGSQTVFYSLPSRVVSSHAALIAEVLGLRKSRAVQKFMAMPEQKEKKTRFLPGDLSLFDDVLLLVPNNELFVNAGITKRYWPNEPIVNTSPSDAANVWEEYFANYADYLRPRHNVVMGLTGGVDSRAMIATMRDTGLLMRYETWDSMPVVERERVDRMVEHLGGEHRWIERRKTDDSSDFQETVLAAQHAAGFTRGKPTLPAQVEIGAGPNDLFIFGHGGGVLAAAYSTKAKTWLPSEPLHLACRLHGGSGYNKGSQAYKDFLTEAFARFLDRGNYGAELHGADVGDLLYLENRMANWAALQIAVHVVGMNAHAGINSRRMFATFWGLDLEHRVNKSVMLDVMKRHDEVLHSI